MIKKILIVSDGCVLEFQEKVERIGREKLSEPRLVYLYTKGSKTKVGLTLTLTETQFKYMIDNKIAREI